MREESRILWAFVRAKRARARLEPHAKAHTIDESADHHAAMWCNTG